MCPTLFLNWIFPNLLDFFLEIVLACLSQKKLIRQQETGRLELKHPAKFGKGRVTLQFDLDPIKGLICILL